MRESSDLSGTKSVVCEGNCGVSVMWYELI